jgi:membrane protease subunit HflK
MRYVVGLAVLLFLLSLLTGVTQVRPGERAVVRRFGRVLDEKPGPGLYIGLPWGIDRVDRIPVELIRRVPVGYNPDGEDEGSLTPPGQMVTGDHNLLNIQVVVGYAVHADEVERFALLADQADGLVARTAEAALVEWVAGRTVNGLIAGDRAALQQQLKEQTQERLGKYELGVEIQTVTITYLHPPGQVKDAFAQVAQAETERETVINNANQEADRQRRQAESEAQILRRRADTDARTERLLAAAEAETFTKRLGQYRELRKANPKYLNSLWWDEISRLYARLRQTGRIDLLDHYLGTDGLDITQIPALPKKR